MRVLYFFFHENEIIQIRLLRGLQLQLYYMHNAEFSKSEGKSGQLLFLDYYRDSLSVFYEKVFVGEFLHVILSSHSLYNVAAS